MNRPPLEWKEVHTIEGADGMTVRIQRRGDVHPQYSFRIGHIRPADEQDDRLIPFVRVRIDQLLPNRTALALVTQAYDWIATDVQRYKANFEGNGRRRAGIDRCDP